MGTRCDRLGSWQAAESRMRHWPSIFCHVLFFHKSGPRPAGYPEELEGDQGIQERCLFAAQGSDEKVANLHLPALGAELTKLSKEQADYIGVGVDGPFKGDTYRYGSRKRFLFEATALCLHT